MNQKQKYWVLSLLLGLVLLLGLPAPSYAVESSASAEAKVLHVLNRLSFGPRPRDLERMKSTGIEAYLKSQLTPASIAQPQSLTQQLDSLETLRMTPAELVNEYRQSHRNAQAQPLSPQMRRAAQKRSQQFLQQALQGRLLRAILSRQLAEQSAQ